MFAWREISVLYKQAAIGVLWVVGQPLITVAIFTIIFGQLVGINSDPIPYPVFAMVGLLPWQFFMKAVTTGSASLVANRGLLTKTYFPRLILPASAVLAGLLDLAIGLVALAGLMLFYGVPVTPRLLLCPAFLLVVALLALGVAVTLSGINALYRDVGVVLPFLLQIWMYATPIIYPISFIPEGWQWLIRLNPMSGLINGLRWSVLGMGTFDGAALAMSLAWTTMLLIGGCHLFRRLEREIVDRI